MGPLGLTILATSLASSTTSPKQSDCRPIPGWDQVLARDAVKWIVIGELHGTNETPAIFGDAVCLSARTRGAVVVALEQPSADQAAVDAFIASDGGAQAKAAFLKSVMWHMPFKDGRSSEAYFALFERLRRMHGAGAVARVVVFQDSRPGEDPSAGQGPYEERLAAIVRDAGAHGATVIALVGNLHARKTEADFGKPFMPMASHLPGDRTLTLDVLGNGGTAWYCSGRAPTDCGPQPNLSSLPPRQRSVVLRPVMDGAYDGVLELGAPTTASPPQAAP